MSSLPAAAPKPKKSVALSGIPAGNTALCTVGRAGNDLHYRGYDILDFADQAEFEEVAYLLVHEKLPTREELKKYKAKLQSLRTLPGPLRTALEQLPKKAHPMDVMRTAVSVLGTLEPEAEDHNAANQRKSPPETIADHARKSPAHHHPDEAQSQDRREGAARNRPVLHDRRNRHAEHLVVDTVDNDHECRHEHNELLITAPAALVECLADVMDSEDPVERFGVCGGLSADERTQLFARDREPATRVALGIPIPVPVMAGVQLGLFDLTHTDTTSRKGAA